MLKHILNLTRKYRQSCIAPLNVVVGYVIIFLLLFAQTSFGENDPDYAEISAYVYIQDVEGEEIPVIIRSKTIYLSVADLFDFLKIKINYKPGSDSLSGFLLISNPVF